MTGVAAAVAGVFAHPAATRAEPAAKTSVPASTRRASPAPANGEASPEVLLEALREARRTQRRKKKSRRRAAQRARAEEEKAADADAGVECGDTQMPVAPDAPADEVQSDGRRRLEFSPVRDAMAAAAPAGIEEQAGRNEEASPRPKQQILELTPENLQRHVERSSSHGGMQQSASVDGSERPSTRYTRASNVPEEIKAAAKAYEERLALQRRQAAEAQDVAENGRFEEVASRRKQHSKSPRGAGKARNAPYTRK